MSVLSLRLPDSLHRRARVLAERDHLASGAGVVLADLPLYEGGSFYGAWGDWLALASALYLVAFGAVRRRARSA